MFGLNKLINKIIIWKKFFLFIWLSLSNIKVSQSKIVTYDECKTKKSSRGLMYNYTLIYLFPAVSFGLHISRKRIHFPSEFTGGSSLILDWIAHIYASLSIECCLVGTWKCINLQTWGNKPERFHVKPVNPLKGLIRAFSLWVSPLHPNVAFRWC